MPLHDKTLSLVATGGTLVLLAACAAPAGREPTQPAAVEREATRPAAAEREIPRGQPARDAARPDHATPASPAAPATALPKPAPQPAAPRIVTPDYYSLADAGLKTALEQTLMQAGELRAILRLDHKDYVLSVKVAQLDKPLAGFSMTATIKANWVLAREADDSTLFSRTVRSSHTVQLGASMVGATRLQMAIEGAARENVALGLRQLAALKL